jgi:hypothetical protein
LNPEFDRLSVRTSDFGVYPVIRGEKYNSVVSGIKSHTIIFTNLYCDILEFNPARITICSKCQPHIIKDIEGIIGGFRPAKASLYIAFRLPVFGVSIRYDAVSTSICHLVAPMLYVINNYRVF